MVSVCGTNRRRVYAPGHCSKFSRTRETAHLAPCICQRYDDHVLFATCQPRFLKLRHGHFRFDHAKNDNGINMIRDDTMAVIALAPRFHSRKLWRRAQLIFSDSFWRVEALARPTRVPSREVEESAGSRLRFHRSVSALPAVHQASRIDHLVPIRGA